MTIGSRHDGEYVPGGPRTHDSYLGRDPPLTPANQVVVIALSTIAESVRLFRLPASRPMETFSQDRVTKTFKETAKMSTYKRSNVKHAPSRLRARLTYLARDPPVKLLVDGP